MSTICQYYHFIVGGMFYKNRRFYLGVYLADVILDFRSLNWEITLNFFHINFKIKAINEFYRKMG